MNEAPRRLEALDVVAGDALEAHETPYGSVGIVHRGHDLAVWWIRKDDEAIEPAWFVLDREDFLYVVEGQLLLELRDESQPPLLLSPGECAVVPADTPVRGYRYPRNGEPCVFLAISVADACERRIPVRNGSGPRPARGGGRA